MFERHIQFGMPLVGLRSEAEISAVASAQTDERKLLEAQVALSQQATAMLNSIKSTTDEIKRRQQVAHAKLAESTVELAVLVAEHIVRQSIEKGEYNIESVVSQMVERCGNDGSIVVRLHPKDKELLEKNASEQNAIGQVEILADASLTRGACAADAGDFGLLTTIEQQLDDLRIWLKEGLEDDLNTTITQDSRDRSTPEFV